MTERELKVATEFCKLVEVANLFEYLGIPPHTGPDAAKEALAKKRKYMQAMQSNPKFKVSARFLIKHYRQLDAVVADAPAHLEAMRKEKENDVLPMVIIALDGVLADGRMTAEEEGFVRKLAIDFGLSTSRYEEILRERAKANNATIDLASSSAESALLGLGENSLDSFTMDGSTQIRQLRGAEGHGWWDASFTRLLLETIPGGPGELIDIYCRTALSALTLLPERRQLTYLGVDRSSERINEARESIRTHGFADQVKRIALTTGLPDKLPIDDESVDFVLAVRALANLEDTRPVFADAMRVLRDGGRMIVAEPDGFAECFYFDGNLVEYNEAFHRLVVAVDRARHGAAPPIGRPGLAIGPTLSARMNVAGFEPESVRTHASNNVKLRRFGKFLRQLKRYPAALAASAGLSDSPEIKAVEEAVGGLRALIPDSHVGMGGHVLPMFVAVGLKEDLSWLSYPRLR